MRDDAPHDKFSPGVSEEQIRRAEELLGGLSLQSFIEKRERSDYRSGALRSDETGEAIPVRVSAEAIDVEQRFVVISRKALHAMPRAEIGTQLLGRTQMMKGWLEEGRDGRRSEDRSEGSPLSVAFFHREE